MPFGHKTISQSCASLRGIEFDEYAPSYAAGMENSLKALLGKCADQYIEVKLRWLLRHFPTLRAAGAAVRVLDYGCGTATLLRLMAAAGVRATLIGCDVSSHMLKEAEDRWPEPLCATKPALYLQQAARTPFHAGEFDLVVISAVLHHVPPMDRPLVYAELCRVARPDGHIVVFEHNPLNPVTRFVVSRTPIDRGAVLLRAREVASGLTAAGATSVRTRYLMFTPPRMRVPDMLEAQLARLPMGAQYVLTASPGQRVPLEQSARVP
jgi:SAM-dependent methyltransferase